MCIVIDPPSLVPIFKDADPEHLEFSAVKEWIFSGPGKLIMGGTKYKSELARVASVLNVIRELEKQRKIIRKDDDLVDADEAEVKKIEPALDFDDPHLVALVRLSGCKLICIRDPRAHRFLRKNSLYQSSKHRPKLYTRLKNAKLLCKDNIAPCCR